MSPFEDALARVRCCIRGGMVTENGVSDSDLEVIADIFTVSLRCPVSVYLGTLGVLSFCVCCCAPL